MPSSGCQTCARSEEHTSELQSHDNLVCRLLLEKKTNTHPRSAPRDGTHLDHHIARTRRARLAEGPSPMSRACQSVAFVGFLRLLFFFLKMTAPPEFHLFPPPDPFQI